MPYILDLIKDKNPLLFYYSVASLLGALLCLALMRFSSVELNGVNIWLKPFKFFVSVVLFSATMAFYLSFLDNQLQVKWYSWSLVLWLSIELFLIVFQAARGRASHFNIATASDRFIFNLMAIAITLLMFHTLYMAVLFFDQKQFNAPEVMVWAIKFSLLITVLFAFEGFLMGAMLKHSVGESSVQRALPILNWSRAFGDLRVAHFFGIHALQLVPLFCYFWAQSIRDALVISLIYLGFTSFTLIQALLGQPFIK
ncbi:MAG: hypothetical protein JST78_09015 [Bacteroidetes bacterium]|nr:hypothetical protein [Bacteroidota bacterium]